MILPWVKIEWISDHKGYGLVASQNIPKGTVSFVQDGLDIIISKDDIKNVDPHLMEYVEKYSYEDYLGNRIISWDLGKYMNHDDDASTLSTGYGFEVTVRDIYQGEEITDDYRIFSTHHDTEAFSGRGKLEDFRPWSEELITMWDDRVKSALLDVEKVEQPLQRFVDKDIWQEVLDLKKSMALYKSVADALPLRYYLQSMGVMTGPE